MCIAIGQECFKAQPMKSNTTCVLPINSARHIAYVPSNVPLDTHDGAIMRPKKEQASYSRIHSVIVTISTKTHSSRQEIERNDVKRTRKKSEFRPKM